MTETAGLLLSLQMADSAFPSGSFAFSWGLETLKADGRVTNSDGVLDFARAQLCRRWATADRVMLRRAAAAGSMEELVELDREVEAMTLARELREGSCRAGRALLRTHSAIGVEEAAAYRAAIAENRALGHLPVAQAIAWRGAGMTIGAMEAVSAWTLAAGIAQAGVRLALLGPIEAQALLGGLREAIAEVLQEAPPARAHAFTPASDIAVMRHETGASRLFGN